MRASFLQNHKPDNQQKLSWNETRIPNLSPIKKNINAYTMEDNNYGDDLSMVLLLDEHLCVTGISDNTDLVRNNIPEKQIFGPILSLHWT